VAEPGVALGKVICCILQQSFAYHVAIANADVITAIILICRTLQILNGPIIIIIKREPVIGAQTHHNGNCQEG
jgi:hypothetical protein